ncbi:unnamed protein product [Xyrichtys novacula]|uniref:Unnamed protein product n=1 Tax=Xyrichtys novacula TaxID=13765 RepID=A0AAV1FX44_XYRNO|nr:unnamed protein product [Xyrichtys novacula]
METLNLQPSQPQCPPTSAGSSDRGGGAGWGGLLQDGTLIERLSDEPGHHIYQTHPSCPTNGHK